MKIDVSAQDKASNNQSRSCEKKEKTTFYAPYLW